MTMFANLRRDWTLLLVVLAALVAAAAAGGQQPRGEPFSTAITKLKDGLYVIPGYDGAATGGNVAVRVTSEGTIIGGLQFHASWRRATPATGRAVSLSR